jgi:hypothetical protein
MHPRERVLGLARLLDNKGAAYPPRLIEEAARLGITLSSKPPKENLNTNSKEKPNNG